MRLMHANEMSIQEANERYFNEQIAFIVNDGKQITVNPNERVKGYNRLSDAAQRFFDDMDETHSLRAQSYIAKSVKEYSQYLKVTFTNGGWLHYYPDGTWS